MALVIRGFAIRGFDYLRIPLNTQNLKFVNHGFSFNHSRTLDQNAIKIMEKSLHSTGGPRYPQSFHMRIRSFSFQKLV